MPIKEQNKKLCPDKRKEMSQKWSEWRQNQSESKINEMNQKRRCKRLSKAQNNGFLVLYPHGCIHSWLNSVFKVPQTDVHTLPTMAAWQFPLKSCLSNQSKKHRCEVFNYQTPQAIRMFFHRMLRTQVVVRLLKLPVVQHGGIFMGVMQSWIQWDQILVT